MNIKSDEICQTIFSANKTAIETKTNACTYRDLQVLRAIFFEVEKQFKVCLKCTKTLNLKRELKKGLFLTILVF